MSNSLKGIIAKISNLILPLKKPNAFQRLSAISAEEKLLSYEEYRAKVELSKFRVSIYPEDRRFGSTDCSAITPVPINPKSPKTSKELADS